MTAALVIDDHPVTHLGCRPLLQEAGFDPVLEARSSGEGYRLANTHRPAVIILDLGLPGVGGLAMIPRLLDKAPAARILISACMTTPSSPPGRSKQAPMAISPRWRGRRS